MITRARSAAEIINAQKVLKFITGIINPAKESGPRELRKPVIFSLSRKKATSPVLYMIRKEPAIISSRATSLSHILFLSRTIG